MSPTSRLKRALATLLLHFARAFTVTIAISRDSPDSDVQKAFRKVMLKAHPDKAGGCADAAKKLNAACSSWQDSKKIPGKAGRPGGTATKTDAQAMASITLENPLRRDAS